MWVFLASHDWPLDSSVIEAPQAEHAAEASVQRPWLHHKQQNVVQLGFPDTLQSSQAIQLGFHVKQELAKPVQLGFLDTNHLAKPEQLGFHLPGPARVGFYHKHALTSADQVWFQGSPRKLANGTTASANTAQVSPSIVVIIIVLTVIFFLSAFLHLLIRWLARNPAMIRRGVRIGTHSNNRIIGLTALHGQLQQLFRIQDAGLERSLVEELPVFSYKTAMGGLKNGADCAICLCEFVGDDQLRLLPFCGHAFHTECIDTWLLSHSTCPLCRALLVPECWVPGMLPLPSSEISTVGPEVDHQHVANAGMVPAVSSRFTGSSRRSSLGHVTIIAGTVASPPGDYNQSRLSAASQSQLHLNLPIPLSNVMDPAILDDADSANQASSATSAAKTNKSTNEGTSSANAKALNSGSSAMAAMMDSGRLSYTSLGNQTDVQSETYTDLDRASAYGSGRRVSVHLGKCRMVREQGKSSRKFKASVDACRRSYSKGRYEYVIDGSSNLEVIIPPATTLDPHSKRQLNDLLNLSRRTTASSVAEITSNATHGPRDSVSKILSPIWATASFRKFRLSDGGDDAGMSTEAMNALLNTSLPSDKLAAGIEHWPAAAMPDLPESSAATSMRANVGSDASFSLEIVNGGLAEVMASHNIGLAEEESSKRAMSFRLPTPASHHTLSARLKASASRRALSESEAFSHWEPTITNQYLHQASDDLRLVLNDNIGSHRSSSFAKRTIEWLMGWQRRTVHPDKSAQPN